MAELAQYAGPDRMQRLIDGAKKEGKLNLYTSAPTDDMALLVAGFEKKYGIKVNIWRASADKVLQRSITEAQAKRFTVDVMETNGPELEAMHREKILQQIKSPVLKDVMPEAIRPHGEWIGTRLNVFVQGYNTNLVKKEDLPKTWEDLTNPRWKGHLGIEAGDFDWLAGMAGMMGEARVVKLFKDIVAANGISVRSGHTLLTQLVASGEVPLALTIYNYKAEQLGHKGAPLKWFSIGTAIARPNGIGVARAAPNPNAAILFFEYELSEEGQNILLKRDFVPTNTKVKSPLGNLPIKFIDAGVILDDYAKWDKLYQEIFISKSK
jgi:iron(III) transport system substrate-binding protein